MGNWWVTLPQFLLHRETCCYYTTITTGAQPRNRTPICCLQNSRSAIELVRRTRSWIRTNTGAGLSRLPLPLGYTSIKELCLRTDSNCHLTRFELAASSIWATWACLRRDSNPQRTVSKTVVYTGSTTETMCVRMELHHPSRSICFTGRPATPTVY